VPPVLAEQSRREDADPGENPDEQRKLETSPQARPVMKTRSRKRSRSAPRFRTKPTRPSPRSGS
jgi:hypothetical protein